MDGSNVSPGVLYDRELNGYETPDSGLGDDGVSERFTHEQMDAAISVIKNESYASEISFNWLISAKCPPEEAIKQSFTKNTSLL